MKNIVIASLLAVAACASFAQSAAGGTETQFDQTHPRRAEVNARLAKQNQRIRHEVKEGEISKAQAAQLHKEDRRMRKEERLMAAQNGGHITKQEKRTLNQQENKESAQIGK